MLQAGKKVFENNFLVGSQNILNSLREQQQQQQQQKKKTNDLDIEL